MNKRARHLLVAGACTLIAACLILVGTLHASAINRQMHAWKLLPEPERLTELYFTDHTKLPASYTPGQTQTVAFTVHNLEYRTTTYSYAIYQVSQNGNAKLPLASGRFTLLQNGYARPQIPVTLGDIDRSQIRIDLGPTNESISYWVDKV